MSQTFAAKTTPSSNWREEGLPDPFSDRYDCERHELTLGEYTDDRLANEVYLNGNRIPTIDDIMSLKPLPTIYLAAAKDRIRWLSRENHKNQESSASLCTLLRELVDECRNAQRDELGELSEGDENTALERAEKFLNERLRSSQ